MRRAVALWAVMAVAYATTIGLASDRGGGSHPRHSAAELSRVAQARELVDDRSFTDEPQGLGYTVLIAPAVAIGGATAVEVEMLLFAALAVVLAAELARRLVPDPWATRAAVVTGLSPPALWMSTDISPAAPGAALLAGATLLALGVRDRPRTGAAAACAGLVALAPWLRLSFAASGTVVALALARWLRRRQRGLAGFVALELVLTSAVVYVTIDDKVFGGLTPYGTIGDGTGIRTGGDVAARLPRLGRILGDPQVGLLRWAPFLLLAAVSAALLARAARERLHVAIGSFVDVEVTGLFLGLVGLAGLLVAALLAPRFAAPPNPWLVPVDAAAVVPVLGALCAPAIRRFPRIGLALGAATVALGVAWVVTTRW